MSSSNYTITSTPDGRFVVERPGARYVVRPMRFRTFSDWDDATMGGEVQILECTCPGYKHRGDCKHIHMIDKFCE